MKGIRCSRYLEERAPGGKGGETLLLPFGRTEECDVSFPSLPFSLCTILLAFPTSLCP